MLTTLEVTLVRMAIFVFPAPRWEALMTMEMILKIMPPMMIRKYRTALS